MSNFLNVVKKIGEEKSNDQIIKIIIILKLAFFLFVRSLRLAIQRPYNGAIFYQSWTSPYWRKDFPKFGLSKS